MRSAKIFKSIYTLLMLLSIWYLLHRFLNPNIIPSPFRVIEAFFTLMYPTLFYHLLASFYRLFVSILITLVLGYTLGNLIGLFKPLDLLISPLIYALYPLPRIALLPVFMVLFGLGDTSKILLIVTIAIFYIIITTRDAIITIPRDYLIAAKTLRLSNWQTFIHVIMPYTLPMLFTSLRIVLGSSIAALFFTESYGARFGIGYFIMDAWSRMNYIQMYSGIVTISLMGLFLFKLIDFAHKKSSHWV